MEERYNLNELAMMTGFTTRTLRNYMNQGLLAGEKINGAWQFPAAELDRFFKDPYVKEGLRIKRSSLVFDFMADSRKTSDRTCVIIDIPAQLAKGNAISAFICEKIPEVKDINFNFGWDHGTCRVILSGAAESVAHIMKAYYASEFSD